MASSDPLLALRRAIRTSQALAADRDGLRGVVAAVNAFHREHRFAPSIRDLSAMLHWSSEKTRDAVLDLCDAGALAQTAKTARSLRVASEAETVQARKRAWYEALAGLPAVEISAARQALASLDDGSGSDFGPGPSADAGESEVA